MRKLLIILFLCFPMWASVAWVRTNGTDSVTTAASPQSLTLTTGSTAGNTLVVTFSWKSSARRVQYVCSGTSCTNATTTGCLFFPYTWGQPNSATTVASQIWIGLNCPATVTVIVAGFMVDSSGANGTAIADWAVNEYSGVVSIGQVTHATGSSTHPSVSITMQDSGNMLVMGSASLGSLGVPTSSVRNLRSALRNGTTSSFDAVAACDNTAASGSAAVCTVTITTGAWIAQGIELRTGSITSLTDHVQSFGTNISSTDTSTPTVLYTPLTGDPVLGTGGTTSTYNTVVCAASWTYLTTPQTPTVTTNSSWQGSTVDTLTKAVQEDDSSNASSAIFYGNVPPGVTYLTFTFGTALPSNGSFFVTCSQFNHIQRTSPLAVTCGQTNQTQGTLTCGSMTLGASCSSGCVVFYATTPDIPASTGAGFGPGSGYCAAASGYALLIPTTVGGYCTEYQIISSSGAVNPSLYSPIDTISINSNTWMRLVGFNTLEAAFIVDNTQGTALPSTGIHITRSMKYEISSGVSQYIYANCPGGPNHFNEGDMDQTQTTAALSIFDTNQVAYTVND